MFFFLILSESNFYVPQVHCHAFTSLHLSLTYSHGEINLTFMAFVWSVAYNVFARNTNFTRNEKDSHRHFVSFLAIFGNFFLASFFGEFFNQIVKPFLTKF